MDSPDRKKTYSVKFVTDHFEVNNATGRVIMSCSDEHSAQHYAVMLNQAFDAGYKSGYRAARALR